MEGQPGSKHLRSKAVLFFVIAAFPLMTGTTYVVMEGDREVGRYEDHDGRKEVKRIQSETPSPVSSLKMEAGGSRPSNALAEFEQEVLNAKIEDPDLIRFLNRQRWMEKLRQWDSRWHFAEPLNRHRLLIVWSLLFFLLFVIYYKVSNGLRKLLAKRNRSVSGSTAAQEEKEQGN